MGLQINQYTKTRTDLTIQDDDLMDFDSTEDAGVSYESAKITVADFLAYVSANVSSNSIYSADDTITANRTLTANGVYTKWLDGSVIINHVGESSGYGFIVEFSGSERGQLGFNQGLQSAFLELQNFDVGPGLSTFFNAIDGKVAVGHATATSTLHVKGEGATSATTNFLSQNSAGTDIMAILDSGLVGMGESTPLHRLHVVGDGGASIAAFYNSAGSTIMGQIEENGSFRFGRSSGSYILGTSGGVRIFGGSSNTFLHLDSSLIGVKGTIRPEYSENNLTFRTSNNPGLDQDIIFQARDSASGTQNIIVIKDDISGGVPVLNLPSLPTSSAGLSSGDIWNNSGVLNIV